MHTSRPTAPVALALCVVALLAAGCGKESANQVSCDAPAPTSVGNPQILPMPAPGTGTGAPGGAAVQALAQAWQGVNTLSARYELRETKGGEVETARVTFYLKKPGRYHYDVAQHSTAIKNGSSSTFDTKSRKITSHLGGVASFIPIKGTLDDARAKSVRGWTLDQTDYATQIEMYLQPGAQVTAGQNGVLELARPTKYGGGVELMRTQLNPATNLPASVELVAGGQVVYRKTFSQVQVNPSIAADKFAL